MEAARGRGEGHPGDERRQDWRHAGRERPPPNEIGGKGRTDEQSFGLQRFERPHDKWQDIAGDHPEDDGGGDQLGDAWGEPERAEGGHHQTRHDHGAQDISIGNGRGE